MAPKNFVATGPDGESSCPCFFKMPHPKYGLPALFAFKGTIAFEIMKFSDKYRSWFVNDSVYDDGSLYILSPIDPIFLAIPFLHRVAKQGKFMTLDQIFIDHDFQHGLSRLESCLSCSELEELCDRRGPPDLCAYKLNTEKLFHWLAQKVQNVADHLKTTSLHVGSGSQASNFIKASDTSSYTHGDYTSYAFELVSDYVNDEFAEQLKGHLKIVSTPQIMKSKEEPPSKRQKLNGEVTSNGCLDDYRDQKTKEVKKIVKLTAVQRQLAKVDKTGMKSLTSFFAVKPKQI